MIAGGRGDVRSPCATGGHRTSVVVLLRPSARTTASFPEVVSSSSRCPRQGGGVFSLCSTSFPRIGSPRRGRPVRRNDALFRQRLLLGLGGRVLLCCGAYRRAGGSVSVRISEPAFSSPARAFFLRLYRVLPRIWFRPNEAYCPSAFSSGSSSTIFSFPFSRCPSSVSLCASLSFSGSPDRHLLGFWRAFFSSPRSAPPGRPSRRASIRPVTEGVA